MSKHEKKEINENKEVVKTEENENDTSVLTKQIEQLNAELLSKNKMIEELKNQIELINKDYVSKIREKAEQANFLLNQKINELTSKSNNELNEQKKYAIEKQAYKLIEVINQFEYALSIKSTDEKIKKYQAGFNMFLVMFKNLLLDLNITEIDIKVGDKFDPVTMECVEFKHDNSLEENHVLTVVTKGYKLYKRIIQPAIVVLVKKLN
jgi:molecular chaperone GrpE